MPGRNPESVILFEPAGAERLGPIAATRPLWELRVGPATLGEICEWRLGETVASLGGWARPSLTGIAPRPGAEIFAQPSVLILAGNVLLDATALMRLGELATGESIEVGGALIAARLTGEQARERLESLHDSPAAYPAPGAVCETPLGPRIGYWWEIFERAAQSLDALLAGGWRATEFGGPPGDGFHALGEVRCAASTRIEPGAVLDGRQGPVVLDAGVHIGASSTLIGPCYLGPGCRVKPQSQILHGSFAGQQCRLGGEVEETQFQGFANKQHHGFLGHAVVGEWVNLGAGATNSDLKNNYSDVAVSVLGETVNTGRRFVGCCLGDHVKISIQARLNTGTVIEPFCNWFGSDFPPKDLPAFLWGGDDGLTTYEPERALATAAVVMARREMRLEPALRSLYLDLFAASAARRGALAGRPRA